MQTERAYSPAIRPELVHRLYNLSKKQHKPMTKIVNGILGEYFDNKKGKKNKESVHDFDSYEPEYGTDFIKVKCSKCFEILTVDGPADAGYCPRCKEEVFLLPA